MADYEGRIRIAADLSQAGRDVDAFRNRVERASPARVAIETAGFRQAQQSLAQLQKSIGDLNKTPLNILTGTGAGSSAKSDVFRQLSQDAKDFFNSIVKGGKSIEETTAGLRQQAEALNNLASKIASADQSTEAYSGDIAKLSKNATIFFDGVSAGGKTLATTTAGLRQQASAFNALADNINFTDQSQKRFFRNFTQGAEMARTKMAGAGMEQLRALQDLYQKGITGLGQDINPRAGGLDRVLALGKDLPRTKAALSEYRAELERVYDLVETRSLSGGLIAAEISSVEKELLKIEQDRAEANNQINNIKKAGYALTRDQLSLEEENLAAIERQADARRRAQQAVNDVYNRSKSLSRDFGVNPAFALRPAGVSDEEVALRNLISTQSRLNAIEEENLAAVERQVGAKRAEIAAANELVKAQRQEAADAYSGSRALSKDFGVNPAFTLAPAGMSDEQVAKRNLISDRTRAAAEASVFNLMSQRAAQIEAEIKNDLPTLKSIRRNREKIDKHTARTALAEAKNANQLSASGRFAEFQRTRGLSFEERLAQRRPDLVPGAKPGKGFFRGDLRKAAGEGLIGGAFPLLFGQGLGASIGGGAGGFAGGMIGGSFGFGLSLVGTAIGAVVDTTVGKLGDLGGALGSAADSIEAMERAGLKVRDSQKLQVAQLEKVGRGYEAQQQVLKEIESTLGTGSVAQIEKLNDAQKQLANSWAELSLSIGLTLIPGITEAVRAINGLLGRQGGGGSGAAVGTRKPRKPSELLADIDASIALNETYRAANREYASLSREVEDFRRDNEEKIFQMRRQGADIEKEKSDLRLEAENKIFGMRQETAKMAIDTARSRAQLGIESFDLGLARRGEALGGRASAFVDQIREYLRTRGQGESELQAKEKTAKLQIAANERELQQYILQVSSKVASINRTVEDYKRDQAKFRFESSRRIEDYRIKAEDYIYTRVKERYEYAIGSEREILQIKMQAAAALGASLPPDAGRVLGAVGAGGPTAVGMGGLANPLGPQRSGRPPNWNQGLGAGRGHQGQDLGVDVGTTIHAIEDAVVEGIIRGFSRDGNPRAGDAVMLRYLSGQLGVYGHVKPLAGIAPGQRVKAGQQIGTVSDWGKNTHLHYELWKRSRGAGGELLDPTQRLRSAMSGRRMGPPLPAAPSQQKAGPRMLLPGVTGRPIQPSAPATTDSMRDLRQSLAPSGIGEQFISLLGNQGGYEDVAGLQPLPIERLQKWAGAPFRNFIGGKGAFGQPINEKMPDKLKEETIRRIKQLERLKKAFDPFEMEWRQRLNNWKQESDKRSRPSAMPLKELVDIADDIFTRVRNEAQHAVYLRQMEITDSKGGKGSGEKLSDKDAASLRNLRNDSNFLYQHEGDVSEFLSEGQKSVLRKGIKQAIVENPKLQPTLQSFNLHRLNRKFGKILRETIDLETRRGAFSTPQGKVRLQHINKLLDPPKIKPGVGSQFEGAMLPGKFDTSKIESNLGSVASTGLAGLLAQGPTALPVVPFGKTLPAYKPAPAAPVLPPAVPVLPPVPAPMAMPDTSALTRELGRQKKDLLESVELAKKLQKIEDGRLLLQLASTREIRDRLEDAARELAIETQMLDINGSLSENEQSRAAERIRTASAVEQLNILESQSLGIADELLRKGKLQQQEYDQITDGLRSRIEYEKDLLQIAEDRAEVERQNAFRQRSGEIARTTMLTGVGLRAGLIGEQARAYEAELAISGNASQAAKMAELTKRLQDQQLVWDSLEKSIVDTSNAISGGLTTGLVDIVSIISGGRKGDKKKRGEQIKDVGREMFGNIARSFAEPAQQQLTTLLQRQLAGYLGGPEGVLTKMLGAGQAAGPQALAGASGAAATSLWGLNGAAMALGATLQTVAAQAAFSGALGSAGGISSAMPGFLAGFAQAPNLLGSIAPGFQFGGFLAQGGTTSPNKGYIVGENEPEFFFPGVSGRVVPQSDMEKAAELRRANRRPDTIDVSYTVTEQQGQRFVTEEQFRKSNAALLQRSQAATYAGMRNNSGVRDYVGI